MNISVEHRRLALDPYGATFAYSWEEFIALCEREGLEPGWIEDCALDPSDFDLIANWLTEQSGGLLRASPRCCNR